MTEIDRDREEAEERAYQTIGAAALGELARAGVVVQTTRFADQSSAVLERASEAVAVWKTQTTPAGEVGHQLDLLTEAHDELEGDA